MIIHLYIYEVHVWYCVRSFEVFLLCVCVHPIYSGHQSIHWPHHSVLCVAVKVWAAPAGVGRTLTWYGLLSFNTRIRSKTWACLDRGQHTSDVFKENKTHQLVRPLSDTTAVVETNGWIEFKQAALTLFYIKNVAVGHWSTTPAGASLYMYIYFFKVLRSNISVHPPPMKTLLPQQPSSAPSGLSSAPPKPVMVSSRHSTTWVGSVVVVGGHHIIKFKIIKY